MGCRGRGNPAVGRRQHRPKRQRKKLDLTGAGASAVGCRELWRSTDGAGGVSGRAEARSREMEAFADGLLGDVARTGGCRREGDHAEASEHASCRRRHN